MREILFKAKRKNWKELPKEQWWVEGYLVKKLCGRYTTIGFEEFEAYFIVESFGDGGTSYDYIDESTLCQYIGLCDKNGRKIFENDIVTSGRDSTGRKYYSAVYYDEFNCSCCNGVYGWTFVEGYGDIREYKEYEVVGNVFDNYELLEQPEEIEDDDNEPYEPYVESDTRCDLCKYKDECESKIEVTHSMDTRKHYTRWFDEYCKLEREEYNGTTKI